MAPRREVDPYAPPPMHHDRSGAIVRIAILALLLGGGWLGWQYFSSHDQSAGLVGQEQQMADAGLTTAPETAAPPAAEPAAPAPEASPAPTPAPRRSAAPTRSAPRAEPVPPPTTTVEPTAPPPAAVTPIPPDTSTQGE